MRSTSQAMYALYVVAIFTCASKELLAQELLWQKLGNAAGDELGWSVSVGGDADGDGFPDVIGGAPYSACNGAYSGQALLLRGADGVTLQSACGLASEEIGAAVCGNIDVDQDGISDFLVGNVFDSRGGYLAGSFTIYSGANGGVLRDLVGAMSGQELGSAVASLPDLDGDGARDYAVGARGAFGTAQYVDVYSALSGALLFTLTPTGGNLGFGGSVADAGDLNGDGITDILVGDDVGDGVYQRTGRVWVFSGADGSILYSLEGEQYDAEFGHSLDGIGDVDQDGYADFIVGAPKFVVTVTQMGKIYVYSGKSGTMIYSYLGYTGGTGWLGIALSGAGDVNRDGYPDFLATDPGDTSGPGVAGIARLYSGRNGLPLYHWAGSASGAGFGPIDGGSDIDGDGRLDVVVGSDGDSRNGTLAGSVSVYSLETFYCDATPKIQHQRATIDVQMAQTNPGNLVGLALVAIDGAPTFSFLVISTADSLGRYVVSGTVPGGWANHNIDLQSFAIGYTGKVVASNVEHVEFIR